MNVINATLRRADELDFKFFPYILILHLTQLITS